MSGAPRLSRSEICEQLERIFRNDQSKHRHLVAFHGTGDQESLDTATAGRFDVRPVRSEIELREQMPPLHEDDPRVAFLVPWDTEIPIDLQGRFARSGKVHAIGVEERLRIKFGVTEVFDGARTSALAGYLLATAVPDMRVTGGSLTRAAMWNAWLAAAWGVDIDGGLGRDTLLGWAALDGRGPQFTEAMRAPLAAGVRDELLVYLAEQLGVAGPVIWQAWEAGRGRLVLSYALLFETLARSDHAGVKMWVGVRPRQDLGVPQGVDFVAVARALGECVDGALRFVERRTDAGVPRAFAREADALVDMPEVLEALQGDRRLPSAWRARLSALGSALAALATDPAPNRLARASELLEALRTHAMFRDTDQKGTIVRGEMAARLGAWLVARPEQKLEGPPTDHADAELLGRWYAEEGGYIDWARRAARGTAEDAFGKGVQAVVEAADDARMKLDRRFARSLQAWVRAGRPSSNIVPIDDAVKRFAVRFLEEEPTRSLLVILMDGMAWAQAVELLQSLDARTVPWGPLAWHGSAKGRVGPGVYPVVAANLPTVTDVSRAAFFAGKALPVGGAWATSKDVARWAENRDVAKVTERDAPKLLLRGEGHTAGGAATPEALSLVGDKGRRVVAIVINAIDASLHSDPQQRHAWGIDNIRSLPELLEKARAAGRAVMLASDHGHVAADRLQNKGKHENGGARWRPWLAETEPLTEHETGFAGAGVWAPKGAHGVVLLNDDTSRYGGAANAGEHGGATLAEVIAPCLLVGCEELGGAVQPDRGLDVRTRHVPDWWIFALQQEARPEAEPPRPTPPTRPRRAISTKQLQLLPVPAPPPLPAPAAPPASTFARCALLAARTQSEAERAQVAMAVEYLAARHGVASDEAFAAALKVFAWRVGGLVSKLAEVLNVEGYQVLRHDTEFKTIHLDLQMLAQQFEVKL